MNKIDKLLETLIKMQQQIVPKIKPAGKPGSSRMPKAPKTQSAPKIKGFTPESQKNPNRVNSHEQQAIAAGKGMMKKEEVEFFKNGQWKIK